MKFLARFGRNLFIWTAGLGGMWLVASLLIFIEPFRNWIPEGLKIWLFFFWIGFPILPFYILAHAFFDTLDNDNNEPNHPPKGRTTKAREAGDRAQAAMEEHLRNDPPSKRET